MGDWNNVNPSDFDALKLKVSHLLRNVDCLASKDEFGITTLSPPVDAPGPTDPDVLINITTGIIYYWDGNSWEVYTSGGASGIDDVLTINQTLTNDRDINVSTFRLNINGKVYLGTGDATLYTDGDILDLYAADYILMHNKIVYLPTTVPTSASDTGLTGEISWDNDYIYLCINTNTWVRTPLSTWPGGGGTLPYYEVQMLISEPDPVGDPGIFNIQEILYDTFPGPTIWDIGGGTNPGGDGGSLELGTEIHAVGSGIDFVNNSTNTAKLGIAAKPFINGAGKVVWPFLYPNGVENIGLIGLDPGGAFSSGNFNAQVIPLTIRWHY